MLKLIRFEFKKMFTDFAAKYVFLLLVLWTVFSLYNHISGYAVHTATRENNRNDDSLWFFPYEGIKAISFIKNKFYNYETEFTAENLRKVYKDKIKLQKEFKEEVVKHPEWTPFYRNQKLEQSFAKLNDLYPADMCTFLYSLNLSDNTSVINETNENNLKSILPDNFYDKLFDERSYSSNEYISQKEKDLIRSYLVKLPIPYKYKYCEGWKRLAFKFYSFQWYLPALITMLFILILKYEQESGMQSLSFTCKYGRTKSVYAKLIASLLIVLLVYTFVSFVYFIIILSFFGFKGAIVPIQSIQMAQASLYNLNLVQFFILQFFIGFALCVFAVLFAFFIFSIYQNYILALTSSVAVVYILPFILNYTGDQKVLKYTKLFGVGVFDIRTNFFNEDVYAKFLYFFNLPVLRAYGILIIYAFVSLVLIAFIVFNYKRMQIKN